MKAIVQDLYGSSDVLKLREIDKPVVTDHDVLLRVHATSVNPADWHFMRGSPFLMRLMGFGLFKPKRPVLGFDVAGRVEEIGKSVKRFRPGDEIFGWGQGAFAEYVSVSEDAVVRKPGNLSFEQAAAVPLAALTALQGLRDKGQVQAGQKVLIIGASGGVGTFAVQIARSFGAEVTGVCSTRNLEMVGSIGAHHVIDYTREDVTRSGPRYDLIFQLAGIQSPAACRRALTPKGTLVQCSGSGRFTGIDRIIKALVLSPFVSQNLRTFIATVNQEDLLVLKELLETGQVTPVIDRSYTLGELPEALRYLEEGHARGKVVITV